MIAEEINHAQFPLKQAVEISTSGGPAKIMLWHVEGAASTNGSDHNSSDKQRGPAMRRIESVINHMLQHVNKPLRISTLSAIAGVSASHFFWLFKSVMGRAPIDFFIRLRMRCACDLLRDRHLAIKEIAMILGYDDPYYFSRAFKLVMGVAPRDYRNSIPHSQGNSDSAQTDSGKRKVMYSPLRRP